MRPALTVVGSVNLDLVATAQRLPRPGETVTDARFARHPGGKGANQALAAQRLGAVVELIAKVGADPMAEEALALLRRDGVGLQRCSVDPNAPTGVALIAVAADGENQIIVAPGANALLRPEDLEAGFAGALICQLETPLETVAAAVRAARGFVALNLAPAREIEAGILARADLIVVNEIEAAFYGRQLQALEGLVAITAGARGARLLRAGQMIATAEPPPVTATDATGAGDAFVAALTLALIEGQEVGQAMRFACAAGALAATRSGAQPSLPARSEVDAVISAEMSS